MTVMKAPTTTTKMAAQTVLQHGQEIGKETLN